MLEHRFALMETMWMSTKTGELYETAEQAVDALKNGERLRELRRFYVDNIWSDWSDGVEFSR